MSTFAFLRSLVRLVSFDTSVRAPVPVAPPLPLGPVVPPLVPPVGLPPIAQPAVVPAAAGGLVGFGAAAVAGIVPVVVAGRAQAVATYAGTVYDILQQHGPPAGAPGPVELALVLEARSRLVELDNTVAARWQTRRVAASAAPAAARRAASRALNRDCTYRRPRTPVVARQMTTVLGFPAEFVRRQRNVQNAHDTTRRIEMIGRSWETLKGAQYWMASYIVCRVELGQTVLVAKRNADLSYKAWMCRKHGVVGGNVPYTFPN